MVPKNVAHSKTSTRNVFNILIRIVTLMENDTQCGIWIQQSFNDSRPTPRELTLSKSILLLSNSDKKIAIRY